MGDDKLEFSYPTAVSAVQCSVCGLQCVLLTLTSDGVVLQGLTLSHIWSSAYFSSYLKVETIDWKILSWKMWLQTKYLEYTWYNTGTSRSTGMLRLCKCLKNIISVFSPISRNCKCLHFTMISWSQWSEDIVVLWEGCVRCEGVISLSLLDLPYCLTISDLLVFHFNEAAAAILTSLSINQFSQCRLSVL